MATDGENDGTLLKRLRDSQEYNRAIIESLPSALTVVDSDLRIFDVNDRMVRRCGRPRGVLIGAPLMALGELPLDAEAAIRTAVGRDNRDGVRFAFRTSSFEDGPIECSAVGFRAPDGTPLAAILLGSD